VSEHTIVQIALLNPFHGGSHAAWADGLVRHSRHQIELLALPGLSWRWRMRGASLALARMAAERELRPDLLLTTDMLDLASFLALTRRWSAPIPTAIYFHENQLTYPLPKGRERDLSFAFINYLSAQAADAVLFNSLFHQASFLEALPGLLGRYYDYQELDGIAQLTARAQVVPPGLDLARLDAFGPRATPTAQQPPVVLWNGRWEYDKAPEVFFAALDALSARGLAFEVIVAGEPIDPQHAAFVAARERLGSRLLHFGYADPATYARLLWRADVVVSTAIQEFFGIGIVEALYCGVLRLPLTIGAR
jgi:glycosyltransferase involved in cell wall biosynthesis